MVLKRVADFYDLGLRRRQREIECSVGTWQARVMDKNADCPQLCFFEIDGQE
jgi:hypothetical protein